MTIRGTMYSCQISDVSTIEVCFLVLRVFCCFVLYVTTRGWLTYKNSNVC